MKLRSHLALLVVLLAVCSAQAETLGSGRFDTGYARRLWRIQDGLPDQTVQALAQTPDGYLWIGTKSGLLRFDGAQFVLFDQSNTAGLTDSNVNCLLVSHDGTLWIGTEGGGLVRHSNGVFHAVPTSDGHSDSFVRVIFQDRHGVVWVGGDQGLYRVTGPTIERIDGAGNVPAIFVRSIIEDTAGGMWVGGTTLLCFKNAQMTEYPLPGGPGANLITAMLTDRDGQMWTATLSGLYRLLPSGTLVSVGAAPGTIQSLKQRADGGIWIGTLGRGIYAYRNGTLRDANAANMLPSKTILAMFEDREHNLWIGTQAGLVRFARSPMSLFAFPEVEGADGGDSPFESIYQDRDGSVWAASRHLFHTLEGQLRSESLPGLQQLHIRTLMRDRAGQLWVGTDGSGLYHMTPTGWQRYTHMQGLANDFIRVILQARDGSMWIGTDGGVGHLSKGILTGYNTPQGLSYFSITAMLEDRTGDVWVGTSRGLNRIHNETVVKDAITRRLQSQKIWSIYEDAEGGLWFGTSDGLYRLYAHRLTRYSRKEGLASDTVYQILEDRAGFLWLASPYDVTRISRRALESRASGFARTPVTIYPISQELDSVEVSAGIQLGAFLDRQQQVWFATNKGPLRIVPASSRLPAEAFPLTIDQIAIDGRDRLKAASIVLKPNDRRLEISFAAILLRSQEALRYRYRLEGFDRAWSEPTMRRTATYTNLPPGRYRFRVEAYEVDSPSHIAEASLVVEQRPHFYRTFWFVLLCLLVLLLLALALHHYRLRQVAMRFRSVSEERNRLAREMHDTLIQDCASVSALLEAVSSMDFADRTLSRELLNHAREQARTAIDNARNAVWDIRHDESGNQDVSVSVCGMTKRMNERPGVDISCSVVGAPFALPSHANREIMMIVREALFNAQMHARPKRIEVRMVFHERAFTIDVEDDGVGFDSSALRGEDTLHYGLIGMRERAHRLGGDLLIKTRAGSGTSVRIQLPRKMRDV